MYKCGAFNPVTGETVFQSHGTKLLVKSKFRNKYLHLQIFCSLHLTLSSPCVIRFRLLPPGEDSLPHRAGDGVGAALAAARVGVRRVWQSCTSSQVVKKR